MSLHSIKEYWLFCDWCKVMSLHSIKEYWLFCDWCKVESTAREIGSPEMARHYASDLGWKCIKGNDLDFCPSCLTNRTEDIESFIKTKQEKVNAN